MGGRSAPSHEDMRVLICSPALDGRGGMTTAARALIQTAEVHLPDVRMAHVATHPAQRERTRTSAIASLPLTVAAAWRIVTTRPDVVHLFVGPRGSLARKSVLARVARACGCAIVVQPHSGDVDCALYGDDVEGVSRHRLAGLVGRADVLALLRELPIDARFASAPVHIVPNPVAMCDAPVTARRDIDVLYAGRLAPEKGVELLADVVRRLAAERPELRITIAGTAVGIAAESALTALSSLPQVTVTGWVSESDVVSLAQRTRVLLSPSEVDSLPMSVLTAGACGAYVVATPVGETAVLLAEDRGSLVARNADAWTAEVLCALDEIAAAPKAAPGARLRELVQERYALGRVATALRQAYAAAIEHHGSTSPATSISQGGES